MNQKYKSIIKTKKLDAIEIAVSKALINLHNSQDKFASVINVFREFNKIIEEIKNPKTSVEYTM